MTSALRFDTTATTDRAASRWRSWSTRLAVLLGLAAACLFAAWLGYQQQYERPAPTPPADARVGNAGNGRDAAPSGREGPATETVEAGAAARMPVATDAKALRWPFWEFRLRQPIPPREPSLTPLTWRMIGASLSGGKWSVIILRQGKTDPEYVGIGEELPGGYRIDAINDQDVTVSKGKQVMVLSYLGSR